MPPPEDEYPRPAATDRQQLTAIQLRLLDAAAAAFTERGYDATSIDEIGSGIGATKGAVYYSYRSKVDLFLGVYERGMLLLEERLWQALQEVKAGDAAQRLRAACLGQTDNIMRNYAYHVVIQQGLEHRRQLPLRERDRARLGELDAMREQYEGFVRSLIQEGVSDGSIRPVPERLAARTLIGGVVGMAIWYRPRAGQTDPELAELAGQLVDLLLGGFLPA